MEENLTLPIDTTFLGDFDADAVAIAQRQYLQPGDEGVRDLFARVAAWVARAEHPAERLKWAQAYYDLMAGKRFCPGGRVLAGAGTAHGNVLNCFVQGATEHEPSSFAGIMELAKKLALVTKVGGGNGTNIDEIDPSTPQLDLGVTGTVYLSATHPDVHDFIAGLMRPPTNPDGEKVRVTFPGWQRVVYGMDNASAETLALADEHGVGVVRHRVGWTKDVPDDLGGILDAASGVVMDAKLGNAPCIDLSGMRAEGTPIRGSGGTSSGPVSFLAEIFTNFLTWANLGAEQSGPINTLRYVYAPVLRVVRQGGTRRGAGMATIAVSSPHVLDFLTAKDLHREAAEGDISTFNISILVDRVFMEALDENRYVEVLHPIHGTPELLRLPAEYRLGDLIASGDVLLRTHATGGELVRGHAIRASWLWDQIAQHAHGTGEPGLIFVDRINDFSALKNLGKAYQIRSTNPCGEIPLTVGEPCDLGAINLAAYVKVDGQPLTVEYVDGTEAAYVDLTALRADVRIAMRFLDDVLDVNAFALMDNRAASQDLRRLGLGVMGLADMLVKLGLPYDSHEGRNAVSDVMRALATEALAASEALAAERGAYPLYDRLQDDTHAPGLSSYVNFTIPHAPRRNVAFLTVAPTGTTSMLMGVSSGIEPIFSPFVWRRIGGEYRAMLHPQFVADLDVHLHFLPAQVGDVRVVRETPTVDGDGVDLSLDLDGLTTLLQAGHGSVAGLDWIPAGIRARYRFAHDVAPIDHVRMQGAVQVAFDNHSEYGANSLSKTINLPNDATVEDVKGAYLAAYQMGCKGITVYRNGSRGLQVLNTSKDDADDMADVDAEAETAEIMADPELAARLTGYLGEKQAQTRVPWVRPADLPSVTHAASLHDTVNGGTRKFLVVVGSDAGRPIEVILISGKAGEEINADSEALGRLASIALQHGVPPQAIIDTLRGINGGLYGSFGGALVGSKADLIAVALTRAQGEPQDAFRDAQLALAEQPPVVLDAGDSVFMGVLPEGTVLGGESVMPSGVVLAGATRCPVCDNVTLMRQDGCTKCVIGDCGYSKC